MGNIESVKISLKHISLDEKKLTSLGENVKITSGTIKTKDLMK